MKVLTGRRVLFSRCFQGSKRKVLQEAQLGLGVVLPTFGLHDLLEADKT